MRVEGHDPRGEGPTGRTRGRGAAAGSPDDAAGVVLAALADPTRREVVRALTERETRYHLTPGPLSDAMGWMADAGARWDGRLARLQRRLEK